MIGSIIFHILLWTSGRGYKYMMLEREPLFLRVYGKKLKYLFKHIKKDVLKVNEEINVKKEKIKAKKNKINNRAEILDIRKNND